MMNNNTKNMNTNEYLDALSERLFEIVSEKDWSLTRLSLETGISYRELYAIIYGKKGDIRLSTLVKISQNLNEPIPNLLGITKNPFEEYMKGLLKFNSDMAAYLKRSVAL